MIGTSLARKVMEFQYKILRAPLQALDSQLGQRLHGGSRLRIITERGLARADATAGRLLNADDLARHGILRFEHAETAERAAKEADRAGELRAAAEQTREQARTEAEQTRAKARREERERVARAGREAQQAKREAVNQARQEAAAKKREATKRAKAQTEQARQRRSAKDQQVAEKNQRAIAPATAALKEAAKGKSAASAQRAQADKLARLAETEKTSRQRDRSRPS
jgi:thiol:disulfide interchange protein